jgi:CYTH domain-containing protein/CHAD domain-containing protein
MPTRSTRVDRPWGPLVRSFEPSIGFTGDMGYVIDPAAPTSHEVRRVARERLGDAIARLDEVTAGDEVDVETVIHDVRKRCKETRGLARLVRPALGRDFRAVDRLVRGAANELSATRDAHALLATFDTLLAASSAHSDDTLAGLRSVRDHQAALSAEATASIEDGDERILAARALLAQARDRSAWRVPDRWAPLGAGLAATYGDGRRWFRIAYDRPTDRHMHEWRKSVKYLWYQTRLLRDAAPTVMDPLIDQLDALAEALGDDHDLAVLVERLDADPSRFGSTDAVENVRRLAREQQDVLRDAAFRAGATIYVESPDAFRRRVRGYWRLTVRRGRERPIGGIAALAELADAAPRTGAGPRTTIERERKFLVDAIPPGLDLSDRVEIRQGYLATGTQSSVRVRDAGAEGCTLTFKAGIGAERTELEWAIDRDDFDAAWPHTDGKRIAKTRHRIADGDSVIELDVFSGAHGGLVLAEVEFESSAALEAFEAPQWFGAEVTDDGRYTNAALALDGLPDRVGEAGEEVASS